MGELVWRLSGFVELVRPHNLVASALTTLIGYLAVLSACSKCSELNPLIPVLTVVLVAAGGYVINDYFDLNVDMVNKPYRPLPSGRVKPREALILSIILFTSGVAIAVLAGPISLIYAALNAALMFTYSYRIKELGLPGNIVVSFSGASTIIYGGLTAAEFSGSVGMVVRSFLPAIYAFLLLLAREVVKTIEDVEADRLRGVKSLPALVGVRKASVIASLINSSVIVISPIPYLIGYGLIYLILALITDAILIYSTYLLLSRVRSPGDVKVAAFIRSLMKLAIFVGSMAFLSDLILSVVVMK